MFCRFGQLLCLLFSLSQDLLLDPGLHHHHHQDHHNHYAPAKVIIMMLSLAAVGLASLVTAILVAIPRDAPLIGEGIRPPPHHHHRRRHVHYHHHCHHHHHHNFDQLWKRNSSSMIGCLSGGLCSWLVIL